MPAVKAWLESADPYGDRIANAHAQLNMLGGVMPLVFALVLARADRLLGAPAPPDLARRILRRLVPGVGLYYLSAMAEAVTGGQQVRAGRPPGGAVVDVLAPLGMSVGAGLYAWGFGLLAVFCWRATADYRAEGRAQFRRETAHYTAASPHWAGHVPAGYFVGAETVGVLAGFPGLGWLLSGRALIGLPIALAGPGITWAVLPILISPESGSALSGNGVAPIMIWILATSVVSVGSLTAVLLRDRERRAARRVVKAHRMEAPDRVPEPVSEPVPAEPAPAGQQ